MQKNTSVFILVSLSIAILIASCGKADPGNPIGSNQRKAFVFQRKPGSDITFLSTQMNPVEEAGKMRNAILKDFPGKVDFKPNDNSYIFSQIASITKTDPSRPILIGALHGDLVTLFEKNALQPLDEVFKGLEGRKFPETLISLSRLDGKNIFYVPWIQASFVMVANRKALAYLPKGAKLNELTYEQLQQWAKSIQKQTGMKALGFPAGEKGLMHRFFQGYLYPSFTASALLKFRGADAAGMWSYFKDLWSSVHPGSLVFSTMAEPLLAGDVWIAWDHSARLVKAFKEKPDDFVAFPAPIGPKGRGFMAVISGLSVPAMANSQDPAILIDYLTQPVIQDRTLEETGFFPVIVAAKEEGGPRYLRGLRSAMEAQANSPEAVPTLLPVGLGERAGDYNDLFMMTFSEIVLDGKTIQEALNANAAELQKILDTENAKCWLPDRSGERPCKIE